MSEKDTEAAMKDPILAGLTSEQLPCVARVDGPVLVSAGAGSGKTFMITRRITYALAHPQISGVAGIDQVLAITFTTLAASEIKQRVRSSLRANGMAQQALRVDESWISTIHGMCSRMLREHAIELGLDPQFGIIDDTDRDTLLRESINEALGITISQPHNEDDGAESPMVVSRWRDLFDEYENPAHGGGDVAGLVKEIIDTASNVRGGLTAIATGPNPKPASDIARDVWEAMLRLETEVTPLAQKKKPPKFALTVLERLHSDANGTPGDFMAKFAYLAHVDSAGADLQSADHVTSYKELAQALDTFNPKFGIAPKDCKEANIEFRLAYDHACLECMLGLVANLRGELLDLAGQVLTIFAHKKDERGVLDQDDLLLRTLDALEHNESFAAQYRNRFKLVMVDEFQDTSALQIAIISKLDGANHERLCTVGDAQQSIYRFRGADVATYRAHRREMHDDIGALCGQLTCNFRSHNDIIAFVNTVFSQPQVFGGTKGEFIELTTPADRTSSLAHDRSRIEVICVTNGYNKAHSYDRHRVLAQRICDEFRELHDDGSSWGDMVILLGRMASAPIFAQTLRAQGIPCIITGGSIFTQAVAVQLIGNLASCIANPLDDESLQAVLAGEMFDLAPDELLALATQPNGRKRGLWDGLRAAEMAGLAHESEHGHKGGHASTNNSDGDGIDDLLISPRVQLAASTLRQAIARSGWDRPSQVLRDAVLESGWLDRLQTQGPQGMAEAANILKALRLAQKHETDAQTPRSMAAVAARMREELDGSLKEAPGALNSSAQDAVRIMTIHASKGLEFPIVALGDFYNQRMDSGSLGLETSQEKIYLTLRPSRSVSENHAGFANVAGYGITDLADQDKKAQAAGIISADTDEIDPAYTHVAYAFYTAVKNRSYNEELAEMRRKFYVGATRPREVLILAVESAERNPTKDNPALYGDEVIEDLRNALVGPDLDFPDDAEVDFGGHLPAHIQHIRLEKIEDVVCWDGVPIDEILAVESDEDSDEDSVDDDGYAPSMTIPEPTSISSLTPTALPAASVHTSEFSYSSIASYKNIAGVSTGADGSLDPDEMPTDPDEIAPLDDEELEEVELEEAEGRPSSQVRSVFTHHADGNNRTLNTRSAAFGSVFHSAAQWMIERVRLQSIGTRCLELPGLDRLEQLEHAWQMDPSMHDRLVAGLQRWRSSDVAREALGYPTLEPEASLFVTLLGPQGEPLHLNGSVDLFCHDTNEPPEQQRALIVDYKTGGNNRETPEGLHEKHLLQACCYAYGALMQGYAGVDLRFVRVEHVDEVREGSSDQLQGQPQVVSYAFEASQRESLAQSIRAAYSRASLNW